MEIARLYRAAQESFVALAETFDGGDWATPVDCTPGWTVHDVVSHVAGIADDVVNGRTEGAATEPWTAAQVERWRDTPRAQLLAQWSEQAPVVADAFEAIGERRPPIDCHTHEHDVRQALRRPGGRESEIVSTLVGIFCDGWAGRPIDIRFTDGSVVTTAGSGPHRQLSGVTPFDLVRSRMGRRSGAQVTGWDWSEPLESDELDAWFTFGPSAIDIVE